MVRLRVLRGVAVHAQLFGGFTLVAAMGFQHFAQVLFFKFAHCVFVAHAAGVHLRHQAV
jgi:hypothetical protein